MAVAGFGGLGHMALQYAVALGAQASVFDITEDKRQDALNMGAGKYVNVHKPEELQGLDNSFRVMCRCTNPQAEPAVWFRVVTLERKGAFENGNIGALTRQVPANMVASSAPGPRGMPKPPRTPKKPRIVELLRKAIEWRRQLDRRGPHPSRNRRQRRYHSRTCHPNSGFASSGP